MLHLHRHSPPPSPSYVLPQDHLHQLRTTHRELLPLAQPPLSQRLTPRNHSALPNIPQHRPPHASSHTQHSTTLPTPPTEAVFPPVSLLPHEHFICPQTTHPPGPPPGCPTQPLPPQEHSTQFTPPSNLQLPSDLQATTSSPPHSANATDQDPATHSLTSIICGHAPIILSFFYPLCRTLPLRVLHQKIFPPSSSVTFQP